MTDDADSTTSADDGPDTHPARFLLALQRVDSEADLLRGRRDRLPERAELASQTELMRGWEARRRDLQRRIDELGGEIETAEAQGAGLMAERNRLQAQLKTVIAPREAEALMHEIAGVDERSAALDDRELAALEEQSALDDELTAHVAGEEARRDALRQADAALAAACADIDAELEVLGQRRVAAAADLDDALLARYERVRGTLGVAVARLRGHRCEGCHLDLSAAEVDGVKAESSESGFTDCPQCGRMLVV